MVRMELCFDYIGTTEYFACLHMFSSIVIELYSSVRHEAVTMSILFFVRITDYINIYRKKTPTTKNVINIPDVLKAIAPMAQPDSNRKYCSGMSWQCCLYRSGMVPFWHVMHCVSSDGWRICGSVRKKKQMKWAGTTHTHTSFR